MRLERLSEQLLAWSPFLAAVVITANGLTDGSPWWMLATVTWQSLALLFRTRAPLAVVIVVSGLEILLAFQGAVVFVGPLVAAFGLGFRARRRYQHVLGLAVGIGVLLVGYPVLGLAQATLAVSTLFAGFWGIGVLRARRQRDLELLLARQRAAEHERALLAWELHDILNHSTTAMVLDAEAAAETGDDAEARETLRRVARTGRESLAELRRLLGVLHDTRLAPGQDRRLSPRGLDHLEDLVDSFSAGGPRVKLERYGPNQPVDASIGLAAYRVVQESLTNVARHAGAVEVRVEVAYASDRLAVTVANAAPAGRRESMGSGTGLIGMRERVELLGGTLRAGPTHDGGFEVHAVLPVRSTP